MATLAKYYPISGDERIVSIKNGGGDVIPPVAPGVIVAPRRDKGNRLISFKLEIGVTAEEPPPNGGGYDMTFGANDNIVDIVAKLPAGVIRNLVSKAAAGTPILTTWPDVRILPLYLPDLPLADGNNIYQQQMCARSTVAVNVSAQTAAIRLQHLANIIHIGPREEPDPAPWALICVVEIDWLHSIRN